MVWRRFTIAKQLVYWSATGVTERIARPLGGIHLDHYDEEQEFVLLFPSYGSPRTGGYVPTAVKKFLTKHSERLVAVAGVGNLTFGSDFCLGARFVAHHYSVPLIATIDMVPSYVDINAIEEAIQKD